MITKDNLLNCLLWSGFQWNNYYSDTHSDYRSDWTHSYGFELGSLIISTHEYAKDNNQVIVDMPNDIFIDNNVEFYASYFGEEETITTKNFDLFLQFILNFTQLREVECYPLIELATAEITRYFNIEPLDFDSVYLHDKHFSLPATPENLELLNNVYDLNKSLQSKLTKIGACCRKCNDTGEYRTRECDGTGFYETCQTPTREDLLT